MLWAPASCASFCVVAKKCSRGAAPRAQTYKQAVVLRHACVAGVNPCRQGQGFRRVVVPTAPGFAVGCSGSATCFWPKSARKALPGEDTRRADRRRWFSFMNVKKLLVQTRLASKSSGFGAKWCLKLRAHGLTRGERPSHIWGLPQVAAPQVACTRQTSGKTAAPRPRTKEGSRESGHPPLATTPQ